MTGEDKNLRPKIGLKIERLVTQYHGKRYFLGLNLMYTFTQKTTLTQAATPLKISTK